MDLLSCRIQDYKDWCYNHPNQRSEEMLFYCCVGSYEERCILDDTLDKMGFQYRDCCGSQYSCNPKGDFDAFKELVKAICIYKGLNLREIHHLPDVGMGLF